MFLLPEIAERDVGGSGFLLPGDDVDHAARGVAAVQNGPAAADDFDPIDVV